MLVSILLVIVHVDGGNRLPLDIGQVQYPGYHSLPSPNFLRFLFIYQPQWEEGWVSGTTTVQFGVRTQLVKSLAKCAKHFTTELLMQLRKKRKLDNVNILQSLKTVEKDNLKSFLKNSPVTHLEDN